MCLQSNPQIIRLRPHHALCILHFIGKGYSEPFVLNMRRVIRILRQEQAMVKLMMGADEICGSCSNNVQGVCRQEPTPARFDGRCLSRCGLREGQLLSWTTLRETVQKEILEKGYLSRICDGCQWLPLCQSVAK